MGLHTQGRKPRLLVSIGILLLLAGCQPVSPTATSVSSPPAISTLPPPTATAPLQTTVLTVWHSWDTQDEAIFRGLLAEYQAQHPGTTVRLRQVAVGRIISEYEEAVLGGEGPDILAGRSHWIGELAERQAIAPLEDLLGASYWSEFYPFALEGVRVGGHAYAVPYACETVALYYNRDFVSEPPTTTAALLGLASTWPGEGQVGLAFPLSFYNTIGYLYAFGGRLVDEKGHITLDTAEARAWLSWLQEVRESPGVGAVDNYGQADALFKSGAAAMVINGSWALADYLGALGTERLGVTPLPMLDQTQVWPTPLVGYRVLMANPARLIEQPDEVLDLLRVLGGASSQRLLAAQLGAVPTWAQIDLSGAPLLASFVRQAELGRPRQLPPPVEVFWDPVENLLYSVTGRRVPVDLALREAQQQVEQVLQEEGEAWGSGERR